ncbi:MAG TPA: hypothetical protein VFN88_12150 [Caulobacteraceae bacterium]|nr:hypothetical protein [Caulobacteraceae bacterium]
MKKIIATGVAMAFLASAAVPALAQETTTTTVVKKKDNKAAGTAGGAAAGAAAGAVVGGPVGAVVGGAIGAVAGHEAAPPDEVRTYVTTTTAAPVRYGHPIVVGKTIDGDVVWLDVPNYPKYRWQFIDGHRVVIDNDTKDVVAVY